MFSNSEILEKRELALLYYYMRIDFAKRITTTKMNTHEALSLINNTLTFFNLPERFTGSDKLRITRLLVHLNKLIPPTVTDRECRLKIIKDFLEAEREKREEDFYDEALL